MDILHTWGSQGNDGNDATLAEMERNIANSSDLMGVSRLGRSMVWVFYLELKKTVFLMAKRLRISRRPFAW